jgi:hypothetical protein
MKSWEIMRKEMFIIKTKRQSATYISLQILSLFLKDTHLETKPTNDRKPESDRVSKDSGFPSASLVEKRITQMTSASR